MAVIDSGVASWHDDLTIGAHYRTYPYGNQRVSKFVDFVNGLKQPYDDHGHGSHVAGIILGNGFDSAGKQSGMAPDASLVALKVLDQDGKGSISNIIAALDWVVTNGKTYNIRVVNLPPAPGSPSPTDRPADPGCQTSRRSGIVASRRGGQPGKNAQGLSSTAGFCARPTRPGS